ncbi:hypothetical protein HII17_11280 [Thalassotalea sp. M1531]|uniref:Big-1 domain-containing protein n=1 Tax=Thalassotalea algicola TaxID=2716224 RepID=A0A7Y0LD69_9GAMM|nr:Ig-like domain-containing protein [Thalassotalea algicola]NMP32152.1 hypothetical protein [Thalassotalea algicola]
MKNLFTALLVACLGLLVGCNGSSGENTSGPGDSQTPSTITLTIENSAGEAQQSFSADQQITLVATLFDSDDQTIAGRSVNFTVTMGDISVSSKLTNNNGQAIVTISNSDLAAGAGTATATLGSLTVTADYEYTHTSGEQPPKLASQLLLDGIVVSQFKSDQQAQIVATLQNNIGQAVLGEIVTFTADIGTLSTSTALTDSNGQAKVTLSSNDQIGAGVIIASLGEASDVAPSRINYEIIPADSVIIDDGVRIGHISNDGSFVEGEVLVGSTTISAGGTLGLTVDLVDGQGNLISTPTPVSFTSNCVQSGNATVDESVFSIRGTAEATFEDIDCAGSSGTDDVIVAAITINGITSVASQTISISGEELGSIEFISAEPTSIVLKGTGGQGKQETSTLTFQVKSALGNALAQQAVDFVLDTEVGGITLNPASGLTNSEGMVTTKVTAGTVPTAVRVTAKASMTISDEIIDVQTQSDLLSVNTGLPEQSSLTISTSIFNPEANSINGVEATITAQLADNFNNPVPDGTTVNFTTEGGMIEPSCTTTNGACTVNWTSSEPRVPDHRITVLATALGHETFFDTNGNNTFDENDGSAIVNQDVSSGFGRQVAQPSGFVDMSEAWRDDNENTLFDGGETFLDYNNDNAFSAQDGLFNGPQCQGDKCAAQGSQAIHVRKALRMVMASSSALYRLVNSSNTGIIYDSNISGDSLTSLPSINDGSVLGLTLQFWDTAFQVMPQDTQVSITSSVGELDGITSFTVANTINALDTTPSTPNVVHSMSFLIKNPIDGDPESGFLTIEITAPSGNITPSTNTITLN